MNAKKPPETESFDAAELGAMMREMRENLGHELDAVARDLRIRLVYLEAIEAGRLTDLPGNAYVSGFLRSYSDFLGLDGKEIVRRFKMAGAKISSQPQLHLPSPVEEGRLPTASILLVAAVIAAAAYGGWYYMSGSGKGPMETVASLPQEFSSLVDDAKNQTAPTAMATTPEAPAARSDTGSDGSQDSDAAPPETSGATEPSAPETPLPAVSSSEESAVTAAADTVRTASGPASTTGVPVTEPEKAPVAPEAAEAAGSVPEQAASAAVTAMPTAPTSATEAVEAQVATAATSDVPSVPAAPAAPATEAPADEPATMAAPAPAPAPAVVSAPSSNDVVRTAAVPPPVRSNAAPIVASDPRPPAAAPSSPTTPSTGAPSGGVRIVVRATADSYVAVRTSDNEPLFSQLMRPGDSYEVPSGADLTLETGNAGGLQISVGGKRVPPLGPIGEIRRNIPLDAEKLLSGIN
jgi:cytoskeleton protein RodZ